MNSDLEGSSPKAFFAVTTKRRIPTPTGGYQTVKDLLFQPDGISPIPVPPEPVGKKVIGPGKNATSSDWMKLDEQAPAPPSKSHLRMDATKHGLTDVFNLPLDQKPGRKVFAPDEIPHGQDDKPSGICKFPVAPSYDPTHPPPPISVAEASPPPAKKMVPLDTSNKGPNSFVPIERQLGQRRKVDKIPGEDTKEYTQISNMPVSYLRGTQLDGFLAVAAKRGAKDEYRTRVEQEARMHEVRSEKSDVQNLDAWDQAHKRPKEPEVKPLPPAVKPAPAKTGAVAKPAAAAKPAIAPSASVKK